MKISITVDEPTKISTSSTSHKKVKKTIEIPDELSEKVLAVIDELLDRTWDELENTASPHATFPLVPFPFFQKYREPENVGKDDYWVSVWLGTTLLEIIKQRVEIIELLNTLDAVSIGTDPVINIETGQFEGDKFLLSLNRDKLMALNQEVQKEWESTKNGEIDLDSLDYHQALFVLRTLYSKIIEILEVFASGYVTYRNTKLNYFYVTFLEIIDILAPKFPELPEKPWVYENLVGDIQDIEISWEFDSRGVYDFYGKIETLFIKKGSKAFKLNRALEEKLRLTDDAIEEHRKQAKQGFNKMLERVDKEAERLRENIPSQSGKEQEETKITDQKLLFYPEDGKAVYRGADYQFKGKSKALLLVLSGNKNTTYSLEELKEKGNPLIINSNHHFKTPKDVTDTISYIRKNLKVKSGEFFPLERRETGWIWIDKQQK